LKTYCGWSAGVRAVLAKYNLPYTEKDIIQNPAFRWEMETKSGQPLSPCVEINGRMLPDVSGEEVERYLVENKARRSERCRDRRPDQCGVRERATRRRGKN
jgi:monothiol glutaredoxin